MYLLNTVLILLCTIQSVSVYILMGIRYIYSKHSFVQIKNKIIIANRE